MEDPALRDVDRNAERWRDKIELRLDNRQVFFLFFGSAVVACMLFVLGVMVGKRIESRGQAASPELQDPLAALDRAHKPAVGVAPAAAPQLTFPNTLIASPARVKPVKVAAAAPVVAPQPPKPVAPAVAPPAPKPVAPAAPPAPKPVAPAALPLAAPQAKPAPAAAPQPKPAPPAPASRMPAAMMPAADPAKVKGKFTLHLNTFGSADEASAFAQRYPGAFVVSGEVPGRGIAHRVRFGNFPTFKDAASAKESFEKQHGTIALVAAR